MSPPTEQKMDRDVGIGRHLKGLAGSELTRVRPNRLSYLIVVAVRAAEIGCLGILAGLDDAAADGAGAR